MERTKKKTSLASKIKNHIKQPVSPENPLIYSGNSKVMVHTGSTLLDLAIAGKVKRGGGIPGGILVEIFGPEGSGKTVLLCEIGGSIQRLKGDCLFNDPEARLNSTFAKVNGLNMDGLTVNEPDTVTEVFSAIQKWVPNGKGKIHGIMTDSLAALSTNMEMDSKDGDKMGGRRAKEFSEGLRKITRLIKQENYLMVCSNQIRQNMGASEFEEQFTVPGGKAIGFYSTVRLRTYKPTKILKARTVRGVEVKDAIGTKVLIEVYKNSCDRPYRKAHVYIDFRYGIDDIRGNLQYLKDYSNKSFYSIDEIKLDKSIDESIRMVEQDHLEADLREAVIDLWEEIESSFDSHRKQKERM